MAQFYKPQKKLQSSSKLLTNISVKRLSDDGRGIATMPTGPNAGKAVFIEGALPGELVNAKLLKQSARYSEAYINEVVKPNPKRLRPACQHFSRCGGCHVQHMPTEDQHVFKQQTLVEQLTKWAQIEPRKILPTLSTRSYHYRRRVRLGVNAGNPKQDKPIVGFRQKRSNQLVSINECPVMVPSMEKVIEPVKSWLYQHNVSVKHIELIDADQVVGAVIRHNRPLSKSACLDLQQKLQSLDVLCWFQGEKQGPLYTAEGENVVPNLRYCLDDPRSDKALRLSFHPGDFIQANAEVNQLMVNQAIELLNPQPHEHVLDLFCGIGNFSLPLSRRVKSVTGVEGVDAMVLRAEYNAEKNECKNARFLQANLFDWVAFTSTAALSLSYDALILDPPRAGAKTVCENINKLMPKRIVYVSCDSATFARDARLLCDQGYTLSQLGLVDMFPQTSHSEVMGLFTQPSWQ